MPLQNLYLFNIVWTHRPFLNNVKKNCRIRKEVPPQPNPNFDQNLNNKRHHKRTQRGFDNCWKVAWGDEGGSLDACEGLLAEIDSIITLSKRHADTVQSCSILFKLYFTTFQSCSRLFKDVQYCSNWPPILFKVIQYCSKLFKTAQTVLQYCTPPLHPNQRNSGNGLTGFFKESWRQLRSHTSTPIWWATKA